MRTARVLLGSVLAFFLADTLIFTKLYPDPAILSPDASTGYLALSLWNEHKRPIKDRNQILTIGDSRMGFLPKVANEIKSGYTFATIATAGTTPRCWYYMLRDVDPQANRYQALVIPVEDYEDVETYEHHADRIMDFAYLIPLLRWSDIREFSGSFDSRSLQWETAFGIILRGPVYKSDFNDLLLKGRARLRDSALSRSDSASWRYDYVGPTDTVEGLEIDWTKRVVTAPSTVSAAVKDDFQTNFLSDRPEDHGRRSAYLKRWLGKIYEHYRGSATRVIFFRLPRSPYPRPNEPAVNPHSSVRELASQPGVTLDSEHTFESLEDPRWFKDPRHLNGPGSVEFSRMLARHLIEILGPAKPGA